MNYRKIYEKIQQPSLWDEVCQIAPYCRNQADIDIRLEKLKNIDELRGLKYFPLMYTALKHNDSETIDIIYEMFNWVIKENERPYHY